MSLMCKECRSRDTFVCGARDLTSKTGNPLFASAVCGFAVNPIAIFTLLGPLAAAARAVMAFLEARERNNEARETNNPPVLVCKACGYWERITGDENRKH
jgi:hypothetical protein